MAASDKSSQGRLNIDDADFKISRFQGFRVARKNIQIANQSLKLGTLP
jgi:hypothetical protein